MTLPRVSDSTLQRMIGAVLRTGVLISAAVVLAGGALYLVRHGGEPADYRTFHGEPEIDRVLGEIIAGAVGVRARSIIQAGVLLLIATPIARVAFSLVGFAFERDRTYVAITALVLAILLYALITGAGA